MITKRPLFEKQVVAATKPGAPGFFVKNRRYARAYCRESTDAMMHRLAGLKKGRGRFAGLWARLVSGERERQRALDRNLRLEAAR